MVANILDGYSSNFLSCKFKGGILGDNFFFHKYQQYLSQKLCMGPNKIELKRKNQKKSSGLK